MKPSSLRPRVVLGLCLILIGGASLRPAPAAADGYQVQSVTPWMANAAPMGWSSSLNRVIYNARGADGMFDAYSANPNGSDPECLTCQIPSFPGVGAATNRGAADVSPDGRYTLLTVENPDGSQTGASYTEPGKGSDNDIWLATTDGAQAWRLTDISAPGQQAMGTMWARFDRTGNEIVWASLYAPAILNLGYWQLKVANIVWTNGVPSLADVRTIEPQTGRFYEPYGFTPDDSGIVFASDANMPTWMDSQIDTIATDGSGLTRLSPADAPTGVFTNYNEFAFYTPDNAWIVYGRTHDATSGGLDYWIMRPDGTSSQRLTFLNSPWSTESMGYSVVGGLAFDPRDPNRFLAGVATDPQAGNLNAVMVTLAPVSPSNGLTEQFFSDPSFGHLVSSTTNDPSSGFQADASPASGVPATNYSIRWSGGVIPPASGTYTFCAVAEFSDQLRLNGRLLVDGSYSFGQRRCATATETAGTNVPLEFDYEHAFGTGYAQISWIPPGSTSPTIIPSADLVPGAPSAAAPPTGAPSAAAPPTGAPSAAAPPTVVAAAPAHRTAAPVRHAHRPVLRRTRARATGAVRHRGAKRRAARHTRGKRPASRRRTAGRRRSVRPSR